MPSPHSRPRSKRPTPQIILGETKYRGRRHRFGLLGPDRLRHVWTIGKTGVGKSTFLARMIVQDIEAGRGVLLLDPHGDLVRLVLERIPPRRTNDVLLFDPQDTKWPVSLNIFRDDQGRLRRPNVISSQLVSLFYSLWRDSWGPRLEHILRIAILAVATDERASLLLLYRFLTDEHVHTAIVGRCNDPLVRHFWESEWPRYSKRFQSEALSPILNKLGAFLQPTIRPLISQKRSRVHFSSIIERQGIVLADLNVGAVGEDTSHLLGGLLLSSLQLEAMRRTGPCLPPFFVYADEFQRFASSSLATLLSECRKYGLGLVLSHQHMSQLPRPLADAVLGNVGSKVLFRLGADDAERLAREVTPAFGSEDLMNLPPHTAIVRLLICGKEETPFLARLLPLVPAARGASGRVYRIRAQSRARYARARALVEAGINAQFERGM